jgi:hypothetical protein
VRNAFMAGLARTHGVAVHAMNPDGSDHHVMASLEEQNPGPKSKVPDEAAEARRQEFIAHMAGLIACMHDAVPDGHSDAPVLVMSAGLSLFADGGKQLADEAAIRAGINPAQTKGAMLAAVRESVQPWTVPEDQACHYVEDGRSVVQIEKPHIWTKYTNGVRLGYNADGKLCAISVRGASLITTKLPQQG